jgi:drug/metabolite transporter (DMT)-like permease
MQNESFSYNGRTYLGLLGAVLAVAFAAIFVRWCGDTPAIIIAFYRMFWATGLFGLAVWRQKAPFPTLSPRQLKQIFFAGLMLALHFITWIGSLQFTSVAHALMLGSTGPIFALLLAPFFLREIIEKRAVIAVFFATAGVGIIATQDWQAGSTLNPFIGDMLAVSSAVFVTLYFLTGRKMRHDLPLTPYLFLVYGSAGVVLLLISLVAGYPLLDYPGETHFFMFLLALVPTGVGHSLFNWAARRVEVYKVNLAVIGEPLLATILAYLIFHEVPGRAFYLGAALVIAGIFVALWPKSQPLAT